MGGRRGMRTKQMERIAKERIEHLFQLAESEALAGDIGYASRHIQLARKIGMRYNVRIPKELKRRMCRGCHGYLLPGKTGRHRTQSGKAITTCLACGHVTRKPVKRA